MESRVKRFTETEKWRDVWFQDLTDKQKLAWLYLCDTCDASGVFEPNFRLADFSMGITLDWPAFLVVCKDRVTVLPDGKWHLTRFVAFQYGELSEACAPHRNVLKLLNKHGLKERVALPLAKGSLTLKEKDKDKDKEKDRDKDTESLQKIAALFKRRPTTPWSASELKSYAANSKPIEGTSSDDWALLGWYYALPYEGTYRRKDAATLMNNWNAELDRARAHKAKVEPPPKQAFAVMDGAKFAPASTMTPEQEAEFDRKLNQF